MAEVVLPFTAPGTLPAVCVLTGRREGVEAREVSLRGRTALEGTSSVCRVTLPFHREAWDALARRRRDLALASAVAAVSFLAALLGAFWSPWVILLAWPTTAGALAMALVTWRELHAHSPLVLVIGKDGVALDIPSDEAAAAIGEHIELHESARRRASRASRLAEQARARERAGAIPARCPECQARVQVALGQDPRRACALCSHPAMQAA